MEKILIIDDDQKIIQSMESFLMKRAYRIFTATNGVEAYVTATVEKPNLIILDICMPIMDGYAFIEEINKQPELKEIPILVMTGTAAYMKEAFESLGVVQFLTKPITPQDLLENVEHCLHHS